MNQRIKKNTHGRIKTKHKNIVLLPHARNAAHTKRRRLGQSNLSCCEEKSKKKKSPPKPSVLKTF